MVETVGASRRGGWLLLWIGLAGMMACEVLLFAELGGELPAGRWELAGEFVRGNMTPVSWCFYLVFALGLLRWMDGASFLGRYRNRFLVCWLWSVPAWCYFDVMNFYFMRNRATGLRAWEYVNLPEAFSGRVVGYLVAFGAIAPGMFLTGEILQRVGLRRLRVHAAIRAIENRKLKIENGISGAVFLLGLALASIPILVGTPASNLALWVGTWAVLDPINRYFGRPSILGDWFAGRWGRTLSLGAGGLVCGFLWEFWNYWAYTKWTYHLPFLGSWEEFRYFEMPAIGLVGFIAFGLETWAMWQTALLVLGRFVEGEGGRGRTGCTREYGCL